MKSAMLLYEDLMLYTLKHNDPSFIHQHVVDAYAAQNTDGHSKPITVFFALVGLYLHVERDFTGKQVQREHMRLGQCKRQWSRLSAPLQKGSVTVSDVMATLPGDTRDAAIHSWCSSVWKSWRENNPHLVSLMVKEINFR